MDPVFTFKPLTVDDVAAMLGVSVRTVENHIEEQGLPRPVKIGKIRYWHPDVFYGWLDQVLRGGAVAACGQAVSDVGRNGEGAEPVAIRGGRMRARAEPRLSAVERARIRDEAELRKLNG